MSFTSTAYTKGLGICLSNGSWQIIYFCMLLEYYKVHEFMNVFPSNCSFSLNMANMYNTTKNTNESFDKCVTNIEIHILLEN